MSRQTIARIDLGAIRHNLDVISRLAPDSRVMAVVKADGYGHGLRRVIPALRQADAFAVATIGEARQVRDSGWKGRLLLLEGFSNPAELQEAVNLQAEMVIHHQSQTHILQQSSVSGLERLWLKLDSGMHRLGFPLAETQSRYRQLQRYSPEIGLMTHFACADEQDNPMTLQQLDRFNQATAGLDGPRSLANSAAILNFPQSHADWIRPGLALFGVSPCFGSSGSDWGLRPAMSLSCQLIAVNHCAAGDQVGYGAAYRCPEAMPVGVAAIGYGDGYPWISPCGTPVTVNGEETAIIGRVSMDMITIDLRNISNPQVGDQVLVWGASLPVEQVADHIGTIPYDLICGVTSRVHYRSEPELD